MTNTAPNDSVDPTADQQARRADELEDWLTDIRVTLSDDPPGWLTPEDDTADPAQEPTHPAADSGTPAPSATPNRTIEADSPGPAIGRHRAAE